ncbi:hypothetical protein SDC9_63490 [bioreactor metagenome]|uniref:Uncharacterized protein n=1 Tax=bioreactor metagenome TaxID=1076179 RepID=A0A644XLP3_9ZZZZ
MHIEAQILDTKGAAYVCDLQMLQAQHHPARLLLGLINLELHRPAHHHFGKVLLADILHIDRSNVSSTSKDRTTVTDFLDFLELMGDQYNGLSLRAELFENFHQLINLLRSQDSRRFIENNNVCVAIQRFQNLDTLLLADGNILDQGVRVDLERVLAAQRFNPLPGAFHIEQTAFRRFHPQDDILGDGVVLHQLEVLMHHPYPQARSYIGVLDLDRLAIEQDAAAVGTVRPEQNGHQCRFSSPVLTQQCMDFLMFYLQCHLVVRHNTGKRFGDVIHLNRVFAHRQLLISRLFL